MPFLSQDDETVESDSLVTSDTCIPVTAPWPQSSHAIDDLSCVHICELFCVRQGRKCRPSTSRGLSSKEQLPTASPPCAVGDSHRRVDDWADGLL